MNQKAIPAMRPQDVVVLLKLIREGSGTWTQISLARELYMSQSEISESIARSSYARLVFDKGRTVQRQAVVDFIQYGLPYIFPQQPGGFIDPNHVRELNVDHIRLDILLLKPRETSTENHHIQIMTGF